MFADDVKIYKPVNNVHDCFELQEDLDRLEQWSDEWKLKLNASKCNSITFTNKRKNVVSYEYAIGREALTRVKCIKDLGIILSADLSYNGHFTSIRSKAFKLLGILRRNCFKSFKKSTNKLLYTSLVRSQIEYGSVIWNPYQVTKINLLERVQKRFIKLQCINSNIMYHDNEYVIHCKNNNLTTLTFRRKFMDLVFLFKIVNSMVDSPLVESLNFNVPNRTSRFYLCFRLPPRRIDIFKNSVMVRLQATFNDSAILNKNLDLHFNSLTEFKFYLLNVDFM
jgi:hypothetical protein